MCLRTFAASSTILVPASTDEAFHPTTPWGDATGLGDIDAVMTQRDPKDEFRRPALPQALTACIEEAWVSGEWDPEDGSDADLAGSIVEESPSTTISSRPKA